MLVITVVITIGPRVIRFHFLNSSSFLGLSAPLSGLCARTSLLVIRLRFRHTASAAALHSPSGYVFYFVARLHALRSPTFGEGGFISQAKATILPQLCGTTNSSLPFGKADELSVLGVSLNCAIHFEKVKNWFKSPKNYV